jgi:hypothetical protein
MVISDFGMSIDIPDGWYGRLFQVISPEVGPPSLHLSTHPLLEKDDSVSNYALLTADAMGPDDVTVAILSWAKRAQEVPNGLAVADLRVDDAVQLAPQHFVPVNGVSPRQSSAFRMFTKNGRSFSLLVVFGRMNPRSARISEVNRALATLRLGRSRDKQVGGDGDFVNFVPPAGLENAPPATGASIEGVLTTQ